MKTYTISKIAFVAPLALALGACVAEDGRGPDLDDRLDEASSGADDDMELIAPDLRDEGPFDVLRTTGTEQLSNCRMRYAMFTPEGAENAPVVMLAHGLQGNYGSMRGWAEHWASWGVRVVTPTLCNSNVFNANHPKNAADMQEFVTTMELGPAIYAGYSAGGLSAVIAAAQDEDAVALLGLDMVDADDVGLAAAANVDVPAYGISGGPSNCNAEGNGIPVFGAIDGARVIGLQDADHCDFSSPIQFGCRWLCNQSNPNFSPAEINEALLGMTTAAVLLNAGVEPTGDQWWTPGETYYDELAEAGILVEK